jgi:hypothetical protein
VEPNPPWSFREVVSDLIWYPIKRIIGYDKRKCERVESLSSVSLHTRSILA